MRIMERNQELDIIPEEFYTFFSIIKSPREPRHMKVSIDSKKPIRNSQQILAHLHPWNTSKVIPWCLPEDGSGDDTKAGRNRKHGH